MRTHAALLAISPLLGSCWLSDEQAQHAIRHGGSFIGAVANGDYGEAAVHAVGIVSVLLGLGGTGVVGVVGTRAVKSAVRKRRARRVTTTAVCDPSDTAPEGSTP